MEHVVGWFLQTGSADPLAYDEQMTGRATPALQGRIPAGILACSIHLVQVCSANPSGVGLEYLDIFSDTPALGAWSCPSLLHSFMQIDDNSIFSGSDLRC